MEIKEIVPQVCSRIELENFKYMKNLFTYLEKMKEIYFFSKKDIAKNL